MTTELHWSIDIQIEPEDASRTTYAYARLRDGSHPALEAAGRARRSTRDLPQPKLGAELAATRAVTALARKMQDHAAEDLSAVTTQPVHDSAW